GAKPPEGLDRISMVPALVGRPQKQHDFLYWEFHERGSQRAVRSGDWKYLRRMYGDDPKPELYDLKADLGEAKNLAQERPEVVEKMEAFLKDARSDSKELPVKSPN